MKEKRCPKCGAPMVAGHVSDSAVGFWSETARANANSPLRVVPENKPKASPMHPIVTYRCSACGYLEWYASLDRYGI